MKFKKALNVMSDIHAESFVEFTIADGTLVMIDQQDLPILDRESWFAFQTTTTGCWYVGRRKSDSSGKWRLIYLHREILQPPANMMVDHKNGNGLDNRRSNLRIATPAQNRRNSRKATKNPSGFKGVSQDPRDGKWIAYIRSGGKTKNLGRFSSNQAAALAYDEAARSLFGEFARPNFPEITTYKTSEAILEGRSKLSSKYRGVTFDRRTKKWQAKISINGKQITIGRFVTEIEAARAYDERARLALGDASRPNFVL